MTLIEHTTCTIKYLNNKGIGTGYSSHGVVELPYVLPEEIVEFERHKYRGHTDFILKDIILPSKIRSRPVCKYFGSCGGCTLQHLNKKSYVEFKTNLIHELIAKANIQTTIKPLITIPFGNRRRANFKLIKKNNQVYLGFNRFHSHQIINIDECPALLKNLSDLILVLKELCNIILSSKQKAELFLDQADNGSHILLETHTPVPLASSQLEELKKIALKNKIIKITIKVNDVNQVIYQSEEPFVSFGRYSLRAETGGFLQASAMSEKILEEIILKFFLDSAPDIAPTLIDLFCGSGTFTLPLSQFFKVSGLEVDKVALTILNQVIDSNNLDIKVRFCDLFKSPVKKTDLDDYNYALINPPRIGAKEQCYELALSNIDKVAYISCNPESFVEDAKILINGNYELITITPLDQFPFTSHLEVVGTFLKKKV